MNKSWISGFVYFFCFVFYSCCSSRLRTEYSTKRGEKKNKKSSFTSCRSWAKDEALGQNVEPCCREWNESTLCICDRGPLLLREDAFTVQCPGSQFSALSPTETFTFTFLLRSNTNCCNSRLIPSLLFLFCFTFCSLDVGVKSIRTERERCCHPKYPQLLSERYLMPVVPPVGVLV